MAAIGPPLSGGNCLAAMTIHSMSERASARMPCTSSFLLMGSSYAAGRPFHIIADARAAFERLVKGLTEGALEQRPAPTLFAPETPPRPQPQLTPQARTASQAARGQANTSARGLGGG